jgi:acetyl-CoA acyltransferase
MKQAFLDDCVRMPFGQYGGGLAMIRPDDLPAGLIGKDPLARIGGRGAHANDPRYFGFAPVKTADKALSGAGIVWDQVGASEIDEALAAQSPACIDAWNIGPDIVNRHGGAGAMGHPSGASCTRILGTLARSLQAPGERWGLAAVCTGVGRGLAMVLENAMSRPGDLRQA